MQIPIRPYFNRHWNWLPEKRLKTVISNSIKKFKTNLPYRPESVGVCSSVGFFRQNNCLRVFPPPVNCPTINFSPRYFSNIRFIRIPPASSTWPLTAGTLYPSCVYGFTETFRNIYACPPPPLFTLCSSSDSCVRRADIISQRTRTRLRRAKPSR